MNKSILIVDDEFGLADVMAEILGECGYQTTIAINGRAALAVLAEKDVDLVLLDVMMPVFDGPSTLRAMRGEPAYASIPVVLMTAVAEALPAGMPPAYQAALIKPFTPAALLQTVRELLAGAGAR
jgi:CheY-like chemotaxis protein